MEILDLIFIGAVGIGVFISVYSIIKRKKSGKRSGCCGDCTACTRDYESCK